MFFLQRHAFPRICRLTPAATVTFWSASGTTLRAPCSTTLRLRETSETAATTAAHSPTAAPWRASSVEISWPWPSRRTTKNVPVLQVWVLLLRQVRGKLVLHTNFYGISVKITETGCNLLPLVQSHASPRMCWLPRNAGPTPSGCRGRWTVERLSTLLLQSPVTMWSAAATPFLHPAPSPAWSAAATTPSTSLPRTLSATAQRARWSPYRQVL